MVILRHSHHHRLICLSLAFSYTQEVPSRFKKEICAAAAAAADRKMICLEGLKRVLRNIGYDNDHRLSAQELESIFHEVGGKTNNYLIPVERLVKLL